MRMRMPRLTRILMLMRTLILKLTLTLKMRWASSAAKLRRQVPLPWVGKMSSTARLRHHGSATTSANVLWGSEPRPQDAHAGSKPHLGGSRPRPQDGQAAGRQAARDRLRYDEWRERAPPPGSAITLCYHEWRWASSASKLRYHEWGG